ncbi:MAG: hypothetical protein J5733_12040 [Bacteroidaceae bacterium]|nr:hypothetical protein [Bacteroidaceae bacterium]
MDKKNEFHEMIGEHLNAISEQINRGDGRSLLVVADDKAGSSIGMYGAPHDIGLAIIETILSNEKFEEFMKPICFAVTLNEMKKRGGNKALKEAMISLGFGEDGAADLMRCLSRDSKPKMMS